jgi:hypothetical protein
MTPMSARSRRPTKKREKPAPKAAKSNVIDLVSALQESLGTCKAKNVLSHRAPLKHWSRNLLNKVLTDVFAAGVFRDGLPPPGLSRPADVSCVTP